MDKEIEELLRSSAEPVSALDISKRLKKAKNEVNKILYSMGNVERMEIAGKVKWKLKDAPITSTPVTSGATPGPTPVTPGATPGSTPVTSGAIPGSTPVTPGATPGSTPVTSGAIPGSTPVTPGATPGPTPVTPGATPGSSCTSDKDLILEGKISNILKSHGTSEGLSAPDISRFLNDPTILMKDINRVLYKSFKKVSPKGKPMWVLSGIAMATAQPDPLKLNGNNVYALENKPNGDILLKQVKPSVLNEDSSQSTSTVDSPIESSTVDSSIESSAVDSDVVKLKEPVVTTDDSSVTELSTTLGNMDITDDDELDGRVLEFLNAHPDESYKPKQIKDALKVPTRDVIASSLRRLHGKRLIDRINDTELYTVCEDN